MKNNLLPNRNQIIISLLCLCFWAVALFLPYATHMKSVRSLENPDALIYLSVKVQQRLIDNTWDVLLMLSISLLLPLLLIAESFWIRMPFRRFALALFILQAIASAYSLFLIFFTMAAGSIFATPRYPAWIAILSLPFLYICLAVAFLLPVGGKIRKILGYRPEQAMECLNGGE